VQSALRMPSSLQMSEVREDRRCARPLRVRKGVRLDSKVNRCELLINTVIKAGRSQRNTP